MSLTLGLMNAIIRWRTKQQAAALLHGEHYTFTRRYIETSEPIGDYERYENRLYFGNSRRPGVFRRLGLRTIGSVIPETYRADGEIDKPTGWFTNNHGEYGKNGEGMVVGMVWQLPADRNGRERFVAGYRVDDSEIVVDLSTMFVEAPGGGSREVTNVATFHIAPFEYEACRKAARHADSMAQKYAEAEREYQQEFEDAAAAEDGVEKDQAKDQQEKTYE